MDLSIPDMTGLDAAPLLRKLLPDTRIILFTDRMRRKLQTKVGAAIYSKRKTIVEPVFGQIKQARGFRQFLAGIALTVSSLRSSVASILGPHFPRRLR